MDGMSNPVLTFGRFAAMLPMLHDRLAGTPVGKDCSRLDLALAVTEAMTDAEMQHAPNLSDSEVATIATRAGVSQKDFGRLLQRFKSATGGRS